MQIAGWPLLVVLYSLAGYEDAPGTCEKFSGDNQMIVLANIHSAQQYMIYASDWMIWMHKDHKAQDVGQLPLSWGKANRRCLRCGIEHSMYCNA